jgi:hypothetical protein
MTAPRLHPIVIPLFLASTFLLGLCHATYGTNASLVKTAANIVRSERPTYGFGSNGGTSRKYDCSSFVLKAASRAQLAPLPRDSRSQFEFLSDAGRVWTKGSLGWENLQPGDLIFFSGTYRHGHDNPISHVMIYAGDNQMIGAQRSGVGLFDFEPSPPQGNPGDDPKSIYRKKTVYAYVRPNWGKARALASGKITPSDEETGAYLRASSSSLPEIRVKRSAPPQSSRGVWLAPGEE